MGYLDIIILFLSCVFEIYIYDDFFCAFSEFRSDNQTLGKRFFFGLLAVICLLAVNTYGTSYINILGFVIIVWIYCVLVFRANFGTRIIYFLIAILVGMGCEFLFSTLLSLPLYIDEQYSLIHLSDIPWQLFTMKLLTYVLFVIIKRFFRTSKNTINNRIFLYYLCIPIASIAIMILTYYSGIVSSVSIITQISLSISFALMLFGNISVFRAFNRYSEELHINAEQKIIITKQAIDLQHYVQVQRLGVQYQEFVHNISHYLKTIGEFAKENKNYNIISILQGLNIELENNVLATYCDNSVVNAILSEKKSMAEKNNLDLDIYVEPGIDLMGISDIDIITMLSNLLDNALRAAKDADDKSIIVRIYSGNERCFQIIKIVNHFTGIILNTDSGFISTKKEEGIHGMGIKSVENTVEKYDGYLECFVEDNLFTAVLVLPTL
ncbi:GHKL domain-containing protein [bacterium 1xD8-6]|nr:GHKL domain-containing protein [bacterium D16-36]RKI68974.1 GHKL domain-containing protein [bacterium 1xD8-6]